MLNIGIIDDHEIVRAGFQDIISRATDCLVAFGASSGEEAIRCLRESSCNVLLLDLSLREESGVDVLRKVRERFPEVAVLVLSSFPEERYAMTMLRNGASGYLCKDCDAAELLRAIRAVGSGQRYLSATGTKLMTDALLGETPDAPHTQLSERELQVFLRLAQGGSVGDIADKLNLSIKTVSTYRSRVLEKLAISSNAELAVYAVQHGLLTN